MKILVAVDDDADMRKLIRYQLLGDGRLDLIDEASSAKEAVAAAARHHPDVIILDHHIDGDIMGLQAAPLLKEASPNSKILLFTDHNLAIEAAREPAVDAYLSKRNLDQLLLTVQGLCALGPLSDSK